MKKSISLMLCFLIVILTLTVNLSFGATAKQNNNLILDVTASNWLQHQWNKTITDVNDSCYGGNAILNKSVAYQNLYIPLELEANSKYELSFSVKAKEIMRSEIFALAKGGSPAWDKNNYLDATATKVYLRQSDNIAGVSETAWKDVKFTFETDAIADVQYYFNLHFGAGGSTNAATVSDLCLVKIDEEIKPISWLQHQYNSKIEKTTDSHLGGYSVKNSSVAYQNLYTKIDVESKAEYEISFSIKANEVLRTEVFALSNEGTPTWRGGNYLDNKATLEYTRLSETISDTSENAWMNVKYTFETGDVTGKDYYLNIHFGAGGSTNTAYISDFNLIKVREIGLESPENITTWSQYLWNKKIEATTDSRYGGDAIKNSAVAFQNLFRKINVESNSIYTAKFSVKTKEIMWIDIFAVQNGNNIPWNNNAMLDLKSETLTYNKQFEGFTTSEDEWTDIKLIFKTEGTDDVQYYFNIHFGECNSEGAKNTAIVSDFSVTKGGVMPETGLKPDVEPTLNDWDAYLWNNPKHNSSAKLVNSDDSCNGGNAVYNTSVAYQNLFLKLQLEKDSVYKVSFNVKANEIIRIDYCAVNDGESLSWDQNNYLDASLTKEYLRVSNNVADLSHTEWTKVTGMFTVGSLDNVDYYFNIHFGLGGETNDATISDFTITKVYPGYLNDTTLSYCEDYYNLAAASVDLLDITKKTVVEIPLECKTIYTFGVMVKGDGKATLAFDKEGNEVIKSLNLNGKREGISLLSHNTISAIYLILEPKTAISYEDLYVFIPTAISMGTEMGRQENPNTEITPTYLTDEEIEMLSKGEPEPLEYEETEKIPDTGDNSTHYPVIIMFITIALILLLVPKNNRQKQEY